LPLDVPPLGAVPRLPDVVAPEFVLVPARVPLVPRLVSPRKRNCAA
jgi:hypothetical protein